VDSTATRLYEVPGITCEHCKSAIEGDVGELDGVTRVEVDVAAKTVRVEGGSDEAIRATITDIGYEIQD